jgi:probable rRNA maturation factor
MAKGKGSGIVSVKLVTDAEMKKLNKQWRGKDKTTDVLSFSYLTAPQAPRAPSRSSGALEFGDIIISLPQVRRQAKAIGRAPADEFALMLVHGLLHILGHDHETLAQERRMFRLQHDILLQAKIW